MPNPTDYTEAPEWGRQFVDSIGLHVDTAYNLPASDVATAAAFLKNAHIRHVRVPMNMNASYLSLLSTFLSDSGAKALGMTECPEPLTEDTDEAMTQAQIQSVVSTLNGGVEAVESVNEPDERSSADPNWASDAKKCVAANADAEPNLPLLAPSLGYVLTAAPDLGNLSSEVTAGNIHRYFAAHYPGNPGYGGNYSCGTANSTPWVLCEARITVGNSEPLYVTETGYGSTDEVDAVTQAKYLVRVLLLNAKSGITRTYIYCLRDYNNANGFGYDGIVDASFSPKPSYYAIQSLATAIDDKQTVPPQLPTIKLGLAGPSTLNHLYLRNRSGAFILALWNETSSYNSSTNTDTAVAPQNVGVYLPTIPSTLSAESITDAGTLASKTVTPTSQGFNVMVDDHITLVTFVNP